jgi:manganese transport protein
VLQSVQLPFALLPVLHITSKEKYMGVFANSMWIKIVCWLLALVVITTNIYLVAVSVQDFGIS